MIEETVTTTTSGEKDRKVAELANLLSRYLYQRVRCGELARVIG